MNTFKTMSMILNADTKYNHYYGSMIHIIMENWDKIVLLYTPDFDKMQNIVVNGNQFNDQEYKLSLTDAEFDDIENKERIETILVHVKKINEE